MKPSRQQEIRDVLIASEDGLTVQQIADHLGVENKSAQKMIKRVWGVYIDRWTEAKRSQFAAVYMCIEIPLDAPHPIDKYSAAPCGAKRAANASTPI